jgi:hypothetical protein
MSNQSVGPVKVDFLNTFFMIFDGILTAVFENMVFDPTKIARGTSLGPSLFKKCFFERLLLGHVTFLF